METQSLTVYSHHAHSVSADAHRFDRPDHCRVPSNRASATPWVCRARWCFGRSSLDEPVKEIQLTQGKVTIVDDEDFEYLNAHKWYAGRGGHTFYAGRGIRMPDGRWTSEQMHRVVLERKLGRPLVKGQEVDHESGDGLDNRRENLRLATKSQNGRNRHRRAQNTSSKFLGVSWYKRGKKWKSRITVNGTLLHLGYFATEIEAAWAREKILTEHPELMARSNFQLGSTA
jgi:hypothetical protein